MLSLTGEYAVRAAIYLAQHTDECPIPGRRIAEEAHIPPKYLSKILGDLVRHGVLESAPGKHGGFDLRRPAKRTPLQDVLAPFETFEQERCPFGNVHCNVRNPCSAHEQWKMVVDAQRRFLKGTSLHDVSVGAADRVRRSATVRKGPTGRQRPRT